MPSYWTKSKLCWSTRTVADPERTMKPVSRPAVSNRTDLTLPFKMMRPYARCLLALFSGVTEMCLPASWLVFRKTNQLAGRHISVTPENSANKHLAYGRIILNGSVKSVRFDTAGRETGFIVLSGSATVRVDQQSFDLVQYDGIYIPRDCSVAVGAEGGADLAEFSAEVERAYPLKVVRFADISKDPTLKFTAGAPGQQRNLNIVLGKNVEAGRLMAGFTVSEPGNWTSWPPHEHAELLEAMYVYFDMPAPAFGIQMVYYETQYPELVTVVLD